MRCCTAVATARIAGSSERGATRGQNTTTPPRTPTEREISGASPTLAEGSEAVPVAVEGAVVEPVVAVEGGVVAGVAVGGVADASTVAVAGAAELLDVAQADAKSAAKMRVWRMRREWIARARSVSTRSPELIRCGEEALDA